MAGRIVRYSVMDRQMDAIPDRLDPSYRITGISLLTLGLAKKVLIADSIAQVVDPIWQHAGTTLSSVEAWTGALGYTFQLYFDFSGYSDMAIGLAALLGFNFPINFRAPYQARNPTDFWGRWHITLSTFLRDYLYIPLGGNRRSPGRVRVNLLIVMLLGGLWHGAAWTFVLWGAYHGLLLVLYQACAPWWDRRWVWMQRVATFLLVVFGWVLFRGPDVGTALTFYDRMLNPFHMTGPLAISPTVLVAGIGLYLAVTFGRPTSEMQFRATWPWALVVALVFLASFVFIGRGGSPFLYYQF